MKRILLLFFGAFLISFSGFTQSVLIEPNTISNETNSSGNNIQIRGSQQPRITGIRSNGSLGSPTAVGNNNYLLRIGGEGYNGAGFTSEKAEIILSTTQPWTSTANGTEIRFSTTPNGSTLMQRWMTLTGDGFLGIGNSAPISRLDVSNTSLGNSTPSMRLLHTSANGFNRLSFENLSRTEKFLISANVASAASGSLWNVYHSATGNLLTVRGDGNVGIGNNNPAVPLHVNSGASATSSTNGALIIGETSGRHMNFDGDEINAYNNTSVGPLFLNPEGNVVHIGTVLPLFSGANADLWVSGYTQLGATAPKVKMKKLTGTSAASQGTTVNIPHGLGAGSADKILAVDISIEYSSNFWANENYSAGSIQFESYYNDTNIVVRNVAGESGSILSKPIKILVTYEE